MNEDPKWNLYAKFKRADVTDAMGTYMCLNPKQNIHGHHSENLHQICLANPVSIIQVMKDCQKEWKLYF
jgi:hypothetical protein